jgi:hypothetical protein
MNDNKGDFSNNKEWIGDNYTVFEWTIGVLGVYKIQ